MTEINEAIVTEFKKNGMVLIEASQVDTNNKPPYNTYKIVNDTQDSNAFGKTVKYCTIAYEIEVWETNKKASNEKIKKTDKIMSSLGFVRTNVTNQNYLNLHRSARTYELYTKERSN